MSSLENEGLYNDLRDEMRNIKGFHSISPQFNFYSSRFIAKINNLLYNEQIDKNYYRMLHSELLSTKDTCSLHTFLGIEELFRTYKPRLGELDLLYNTDLSTIKMLRDLSEGICKRLSGWNVFCPELPDRIQYLIGKIEKCSETSSLDSKEVYYHISILKSGLLMAGKVHPSKYMEELCNIYANLYEDVVKSDYKFYQEYQNSFVTKGDSLNISSSFTDDVISYGYLDFLIDYNKVLCKLASNLDADPLINDTNANIYNSSIPSALKDKCSNDLFRLRTNFIDNLVSISAPYYWFNEVQGDFVYHCTPAELEEGFDVGSCICQMTTFESLVEYAVQNASLISMANDRDKDSFNESLYETLFKLYRHDMMENYLDVYKEFRQL